jgi:SAM-dependent methyltransferase
MDPAFWDARYAEPEFTYGTEPNDFLREMASRIPPGPVLGLGEGQGRNAVYLASLGHAVTAVDQSAVGLARARELAGLKGVQLETVQADLAAFDLGARPWSGIISIFCHLPSALRAKLYPRFAEVLAPGGVVILEAFTPDQLAYGTGGPKDPDLLCTLDGLRSQFSGLHLEVGLERVRDIQEGHAHHGLSAVVQVVARKP